MKVEESLKKWLDNNHISYKLHLHPAVFTVEEARKLTSFIPGMHCKNLFVKDIKRRKFYLVTLSASKRLDFKALEKLTNWPRLIFADEAELREYLDLSKGAVSPLGLVNDTSNQVEYIVDKEVWNAEIVSFHPNINTETLEFENKDFQQLISCTGTKFQVVEF